MGLFVTNRIHQIITMSFVVSVINGKVNGYEKEILGAEEWLVYMPSTIEDPTKVYRKMREFSPSLLDDKKISNIKMYKCPNKGCNVEFRHKTSLCRHVNYVCRRVARQKCPYCNYITKRPDHVLQHCARSHPKCKPGYLRVRRDT